jgi:ABC-type lipoprotein export system ATPase subunit
LTVLDHVNYDFPKSRLIMLMGRSGSGKTTFMNLLSTLDDVTAGDIFYNAGDGSPEISYSQMSVGDKEKFRRYNIGFVFQFHNLLPEFTAIENVCMPALIAGKSMEEAKSEAHKLLQFLNVESRAEHKPAQLSGGEQQRFAVARALINRPAVVLADEPSGNLDTRHAEELHDLFFQLRDQFQQTFVIVTHNTALAQKSDRQIMLQDGQVVGGQ